MEIVTAPSFSFRARPVPIPAELRIIWRTAIIVLMLGYSRQRRASFAKLHALNNAVRYGVAPVPGAQSALGREGLRVQRWRIEPAFGRAIDFVVGDRLAVWTKIADRAGLELTKTGSAAFHTVVGAPDLLGDEKAVLEAYARLLTEKVVSNILSLRRTSA